ncbi:hypothetical protein [Pararhizobium sp. A13]|uniref:hypothetical protein n=1 Tax=Pararhizobium sp. A13 TaxID=3133975 RepID=UPI00311B3B0B
MEVDRTSLRAWGGARRQADTISASFSAGDYPVLIPSDHHRVGSNSIRWGEEAIHMVFGWIKTNVIVFIAGGNLVSIGDKKCVVSGREMMVSRMNENGKSVRGTGYVRARYRFAMSTRVTGFAACGRVDPTAAGLVSIALDGEADQYGCAEDCRRRQRCERHLTAPIDISPEQMNSALIVLR